MASCENDPRSLGKVVRTQGKNISKLMRFFDSSASDKLPSKSVEASSSERSSDVWVCESEESNEVSKSAIVNNERVCENKESHESLPSMNSHQLGEDCNKVYFPSKTEKSSIPYCRKVPKSGLWDNVNITGKSDGGGLWNVAQIENDTEEMPNSIASSTAQLHDLIAASRAELSKNEPSISDKSNLENYFTSFENSSPQKFRHSDQSSGLEVPCEFQDSEIFQNPLPSLYDCDTNEISFDDEDAMLSDSSSEEDLRCHPLVDNTNYLPAYALHTIIEESCEESERDSRTVTPTNGTVASKLERYFSWDIINDTETDLHKKQDDESTIYSDSLSEDSGSLVGDDTKEIDLHHLASSRLEKYFTSGLVDNQNYFYPDDAEFLDDAPVSDFEEDSIHQKISRSALISSLETQPSASSKNEFHFGSKNLDDNKESLTHSNSSQNISPSICNGTVNDLNTSANFSSCDKSPPGTPAEKNQSLLNYANSIKISELCDSDLICNKPNAQNNAKIEMNTTETSSSVDFDDSSAFGGDNLKSSQNTDSDFLYIDKNENQNVLVVQKPVLETQPVNLVNKDQLANDIQAIIKKLVSYFTDDNSESFKKNLETDYISAWQLLESEIERLLQSIPPNTLDNNSCNSSTIDSNNSDYGSDTIESMDCMTDDDDSADNKNRLNQKCPTVDILNSRYSTDLSSFNISDETLSIWKRLIQSLQKDNALLSENKMCDPTAEARLYIKDQIVTLMHTVTVHDNISEIDKSTNDFSPNPKPLVEAVNENNYSEEINEAFNVNVNHSNISEVLLVNNVATTSKMECSSDEGISDDSTEALQLSAEISSSSKQIDSISNHNSSNNTPPAFLSIAAVDASHSILCESESHAESAPEPISPPPDFQQSPSTKIKITENSNYKKDSDVKFSVFVDIELGDGSVIATDQKESESHHESDVKIPVSNRDMSMKTNSSDSEVKSSPLNESEKLNDSLYAVSKGTHEFTDEPGKSVTTPSRDTGYFSFKSSDDSLLNTSLPSSELLDVPNFKSLKRSVKKFQVSNTLSRSTNNILQTFNVPDTQFSTLQLKPKKSKEVGISPRQFTSLFSPSAVLKRFTGAKVNEIPTPESSIPSKYLKKYARSASVDNDTLFNAISMPHLNTLRPGDSYSELGLYTESNHDSSFALEDNGDAKRYFTGSQSVLSLGSHSASMTSVYSASGCHYGYVTVSGDVLFGLNYNQKSQMMEVFVKQCRNLAAIDVRHNKSNPYVKVYLLPDKTRSGKRKTKTKKNTLNPIFNELLRFPVAKNELESRTLWLSVWNSDLFGRNEFLGEISLLLGYRLLDSPTLRWYPLQERAESLTSPLKCKGELFIALKYVPRDLSLESRFRAAPVISPRGALHVLVKEARNITLNRSSTALDAFCKSYLLPDKSKSSKQKTPVVKKSGHPKWYYTVIYEDLSTDELKERSLELTVWDHDKLTSNEFLGGVRLNTGTGLYHGVPVEWMDARRDESSLWQSMLHSPNMWVDGCLPLRPTMQFYHN